MLVDPTTEAGARTPFHYIARFLVNSTREMTSAPGIMRDYMESGIGRMFHTARYALADRPEDKLPRIGVPTLVVRGEKDPLSQGWAERLARALPQGRLVVVPGYAHGLDRNGAAQLTQLIGEFLARQESSGQALPEAA